MPKSIESQLASSLGRRDEAPNIALAEKIAKAKNAGAVEELVRLIASPTMGIRNDAIKVLYEIGERNPDLIAPHVATFLELLDHKDNRMIWGAMSALAAISATNPEPLAKKLVSILAAMDSGSVITRDKGITILASLATRKKHHTDAMDLLLEQVARAPVNQVPMYAEKMAGVISQPYAQKLISMLKERHDVWAIDSKAKRLEKLIRSLQAMS
jgi:hypothetical protein